MKSSKERRPEAPETIGRLFVHDLSGGRIFSTDTAGRDKQVLVTGCQLPDGIAVETARGHLYWTNMGSPKVADGSIERALIAANAWEASRTMKINGH